MVSPVSLDSGEESTVSGDGAGPSAPSGEQQRDSAGERELGSSSVEARKPQLPYSTLTCTQSVLGCRGVAVCSSGLARRGATAAVCLARCCARHVRMYHTAPYNIVCTSIRLRYMIMYVILQHKYIKVHS